VTWRAARATKFAIRRDENRRWIDNSPEWVHEACEGPLQRLGGRFRALVGNAGAADTFTRLRKLPDASADGSHHAIGNCLFSLPTVPHLFEARSPALAESGLGRRDAQHVHEIVSLAPEPPMLAHADEHVAGAAADLVGMLRDQFEVAATVPVGDGFLVFFHFPVPGGGKVFY